MDGDGDAAASDVVFPNLNGLRLQSRGMVQPSASSRRLAQWPRWGLPSLNSSGRFQRKTPVSDRHSAGETGREFSPAAITRSHRAISHRYRPQTRWRFAFSPASWFQLLTLVWQPFLSSRLFFALKHSLIPCIPSFRFYSSPSPDKTSNAPSTLLEPFPLSLQPRISSPTDPYSPIGQFGIRIASPILSTTATPQGKP